MSGVKDIRVVVSIDFGTTFSGIALAHVEAKNNIEVFNNWPNGELMRPNQMKVPTILLYNRDLEVVGWGNTAVAAGGLYGGASQRSSNSHFLAEQFKLYFSTQEHLPKPLLPEKLEFRKAITDYLIKLREIIQDRVNKKWRGVAFPNQVRLVMTLPVDWPQTSLTDMRNCALKAGLISERHADNLEFLTEPEAAALYCLKNCAEYELNPGDAFMIVDCGGGTIDLTTRYLMQDGGLGEETESTGEACGGSFVDREFLNFIGDKLGISKEKMDELRRDHYTQFQRMLEGFVFSVKSRFNGNEQDFGYTSILYLQSECKILVENAHKDKKPEMEKLRWAIPFKFEDVKKMFDTVVNKILRLINDQLVNAGRKIEAIFMVGGFSESEYLRQRVNEKFKTKVRIVATPMNPISAVVKGALHYGLEFEDDPNKVNFGLNKTIKTRRLKRTYGTNVVDSIVSFLTGGSEAFSLIAKRGDEIAADQAFKRTYVAVSRKQTDMSMNLYCTRRFDVKFINEEDVSLLKKWSITLPPLQQDEPIPPVELSLMFGKLEVTATAYNKKTGQKYQIDCGLPDADRCK